MVDGSIDSLKTGPTRINFQEPGVIRTTPPRGVGPVARWVRLPGTPPRSPPTECSLQRVAALRHRRSQSAPFTNRQYSQPPRRRRWRLLLSTGSGSAGRSCFRSAAATSTGTSRALLRAECASDETGRTRTRIPMRVAVPSSVRGSCQEQPGPSRRMPGSSRGSAVAVSLLLAG